jgi:hypothetical protein
MRLHLLMIFLQLCSACGSDAGANERQSSDPAIRNLRPTAFIKGLIDDTKAAAIERASSSYGIGGVQIDSLGGSERAAIRIANIVRTNKLPVTVNGFCFSACSQYILAASDNVTIRPGSVVAFHGSSYAFNEWSRHHITSGRSFAKIFEETGPLAEDAVNLLIGKSVRLRALQAAFAALEPLCLEPVPDSDPRPPRIRLRYDFWVPDAAYMRALGYNVSETWPATRAEAALKTRPRLPMANLAFGHPRAPFTAALKQCSAA